jgi:hypothetical protein
VEAADKHFCSIHFYCRVKIGAGDEARTR